MICKIISIEEQATPNSTRKVVVVKVADESGCVNLRLVDNQMEGLSVEQIIELRNCKVNVVLEKVRLEIDPWGKIVTGTQLGLGSVNLDNDKSAQIFRAVDEED